jgi:hypothetical protein
VDEVTGVVIRIIMSSSKSTSLLIEEAVQAKKVEFKNIFIETNYINDNKFKQSSQR